ncbi:hypothetical protein Ga0123461_2385 [Mariprofundus aestuarium]|uniref:Cytochrome c domain-containing protein n=1 Tax=Mariprofundus aestuarium TaxID=1921086 RepID=A0A2K8L760_MARES|nr:hypothetical protein [Mariprofundus aestuarium]ATX80784.1 hypothetical protein Ga0123461_2385 [Mariprofundus aestuarium]
MKKMLLSAAAFAVVAVSAVAVAPTTSEAIPAFARQTGAACLACHHLSFPALNAFGRSFKQGALTDVGEQALVEDDHMSITSSVNMTLVLRPNFVSSTTSTTGGASTTTKTATIPADAVLIFGGRVGTNTGTFVEYDGTFANFKLSHAIDAGGGKVGVSIFNSGFGETYALEGGSTFGQHGGLLGGKSISASNQLSGNAGGTGGVGFYYGNELVNASVSLITGTAAAVGGVGNGWKLAPSARVFVTPEVGGMEAGIGFGITSGNTGNLQTTTALAAPGNTLAMKKWMIDGQLQGEIGDIGIGVYADYANAAASTATKLNLFNPALTADKGYSFRAHVKPTHTIVAMAGIGQLKNGARKLAQWTVGAEYEVYQNFVLALIYKNAKTTLVAGGSSTTKTTTIDIEALL